MKFRWILFFTGLLLLWGCRQSPQPTPELQVEATPTLHPIGVDFVTLAPPTAVVIETTPTPLPPASPTPSPTPILYLIEEGDTLLAIAWQRGNSVEDILALNPGVQPELLQIGQQITLPPPATPLAQASASTPVPLQLAVVQIQGYRTPVGSLWLLGEVRNDGPLPVENVQVEVGLRDEVGNLVGTAVSWTAAAIIPSGEKAPFGMLLRETPPGYAYPTVSLVGGQSVQDLGTRYLGVVAEETAVVLDGERARVTGQITNNGNETASTVRLVLTLYDSEGKISGYAQQTLDTPLLPGDNHPFTLEITPPGGEPTNINFLINALRE